MARKLITDIYDSTLVWNRVPVNKQIIFRVDHPFKSKMRGFEVNHTTYDVFRFIIKPIMGTFTSKFF